MPSGGLIVRRRRLEPWTQRVWRLLRRARGSFEKRQRVYVVEVGDARLKQIVLPDACVAGEIAANLEALDATAIFPRLVARYRNELWVEFVDGSALARGATPSCSEIADVFAPIYRCANRIVPLASLTLVERLASDLELLASARVLSAEDRARLAAALPAVTPAQLWLGYDYGDARAQNFLRGADGRLRIIDVESIRRDSPVGVGVVRALIRWPGMDRDELLAELKKRSAPEFDSYLGFLELLFLTTWTKRCVLQGKSARRGSEILARIALHSPK